MRYIRKFIEYLAEITGVADAIRQDTCKEVGSEMQLYASYFKDGSDINKFLIEYPVMCLNHGYSHLYGHQFNTLKEMFDSDNSCSICGCSINYVGTCFMCNTVNYE